MHNESLCKHIKSTKWWDADKKCTSPQSSTESVHIAAKVKEKHTQSDCVFPIVSSDSSRRELTIHLGNSSYKWLLWLHLHEFFFAIGSDLMRHLLWMRWFLFVHTICEICWHIHPNWEEKKNTNCHWNFISVIRFQWIIFAPTIRPYAKAASCTF